MKYCSKCGAPNEDAAKFCVSCGQAMGAAGQGAQAGSDQPAGQNNSYNYGNYGQGTYPGGNQYQQPNVQMGPGMGWYKFLIYFALFVSAILNVVSGFLTMFGVQYDGAADLVYSFFGGMRALDIIMGLVSIALGVFAIVVRQNLAHFKKGAVKNVITLYVVAFVVNLLYVILASVVTGIPMSEFFSGTLLVCFLISILMIVVKYVYFKYRHDMFCN